MQVVVEFKNAFRIFTMVNDEVKSRPWINASKEFSAQLSYSWVQQPIPKPQVFNSNKNISLSFFLIC